MSTDDSSASTNEAKEEERTPVLREDLIDTAVKFLRNGNVRQTPVSQQKAFLAKKGLTDAEIHAALSRVEVVSSTDVGPQNAIYYGHNNRMTPHPPLRSVTFRDYASTIVFIGGASYAAYRVLRSYVLPSWFNIPDPEQERMRRLDENLIDVQNGLKFLVDSVQQTLSVVQQQQDTMNRLVAQLVEKDKTTQAQDHAIQELKTEVATIKSLLLSRDQFPPAPMTNLPPIVSLPSWQISSVKRPEVLNGNHSGHVINERNDNEVKLCPNGSDGDGQQARSRYVSADGTEDNGEKTMVS